MIRGFKLRALYSILLYLLIPLVCLRLLWRGKRAPAYWQRWGERFGITLPKMTSRSIWVHTVSVGEFQAALPLLHLLLQQYPTVPLLVTTMTPTGSQRVQASLGDKVVHVYLPYDLPDVMRRFVHAVQPQVLVLMETELWVNLLHTCHVQKVPVILANARLSARSAQGYQRISALIRPAIQHLHSIAVQTEEEAMRFRNLGATAVHVIGSIKFDLEISDAVLAKGCALRQQWGQRPVWIAASTHLGEDEIILRVFQQLRIQCTDLLLVLVPRHPERFDAVAELCHRFSMARRSQEEIVTANTEIYLGDTMGELMQLYAASDVAFVGGSLVARGGHNPLEPVALGLPVVMGQYTFNFKEITSRLLSEAAAWQVENENALASVILRYLQDEDLRKCTGERGRAFVAKNRGALQRLLPLITTHVKSM
jgi:3-deoxy-D-manno-octulosonic-acid transferase